MPTYLVERYVPSSSEAELHEAAARLQAQASGLRHLRSILVPADELCLSLYEAPSAQTLWEASKTAELPCERVSEAVELARGTRSPRSGYSDEERRRR
jgi:hypothetical protein